MDVKDLRKACGAGLLAAAVFTNPAANAAQATVTVDVDLPTVLVMYHYSNITLDLDQAALAGYLVGGTAGACSTPGDFCDDQLTATPIPVTTIGATNTVPVVLADPGLANSTTTFTLTDVVGVRAFGCATYSASYADGGSEAGISIAGGAVANIDGQPCSFTMTTGDMSFDLDFASVAPGDSLVSAVFDVTITGV